MHVSADKDQDYLFSDIALNENNFQLLIIHIIYVAYILLYVLLYTWCLSVNIDIIPISLVCLKQVEILKF